MSQALPPPPDAFQRALMAEQPADAWLLLAPGRNRARAAALACAGALLGTRDDPRQHPDCSVFDPEELGVDGLRVEHVAQRKEDVISVESAMRYRPRLGPWRAVVLLDADRMNADAQGALLKTAEEPPQGTLLFLSATDLGGLSAALRSRCRALRLGALEAGECARRAAVLGLTIEDAGLLGRAIGAEAMLELASEDRSYLLERLRELQAWRDGPPATADWLETGLDGAKTAEARERCRLLLQGAVGLLASEGSGAPELDPWLERLDLALADLEANVSSSLVLAGLRQAPPPFG